ncbi:hypothetical protein [Leptothermofonsia sichuanensis]|nr:hypothetical protein [Leptothermofonsia sichuanensis]
MIEVSGKCSTDLADYEAFVPGFFSDFLRLTLIVCSILGDRVDNV